RKGGSKTLSPGPRCARATLSLGGERGRSRQVVQKSSNDSAIIARRIHIRVLASQDGKSIPLAYPPKAGAIDCGCAFKEWHGGQKMWRKRELGVRIQESDSNAWCFRAAQEYHG